MSTHDVSLDRILHAIADPTRRRILQALKVKHTGAQAKTAGLCASDIEARIRLSQPTISHHMAVLERSGLIESRKQEQWKWYRRNESVIRGFAKNLRRTL